MNLKRKVLLGMVLVLIFGAQGIGARGYQTRIFNTDGKFEKGYLKLSPDGKRVAFSYLTKGKHFMQVNNKVALVCETKGAFHPAVTFAPDGKSLYYPYYLDGRFSMQVNEKSYGKYDKVEMPVFSKQGKLASFKFQKGDKWYYWVNGDTYGGFPELGELVFNPDETNFAFHYNHRSKWYIQLKEKKIGGFASLGGFFFTLDGKTLGYVFKKSSDDETFFNMGDRNYGPFKMVAQFAPDFSGKSFEAVYQDKDGIYLRNGEKIAGPLSGVTFPKIDSQRIETANGIAFMNHGELYFQLGESGFTGLSGVQSVVCGPQRRIWSFTYQKQGRYFIQIGDTGYGPFDAPVTGPYFSANEKAFAFGYRKNNQNFIQINDKTYPQPQGKGFAITDLESSENGKFAALQYRMGGVDYVRVDEIVYGGRGKIYPGSLKLSPNGRCFAYRFSYNKQEGVQVNDKVFKYDQANLGDFVITADNQFCFVHVKGGRIVMEYLDYN